MDQQIGRQNMDANGMKPKGQSGLQSERDQFKAILDSVDAYIYAKDTQHCFTYANQKVCALLGQSLENLIGQTDEAVVGAERFAELIISEDKVLVGGERIEVQETIFLSSTGRRHTFAVIKTPLRSADGVIIGLCALTTDVTQKVALEGNLKQEHELLQSILDNIDAHIYIKDHEGKYLYASPEVVKLYHRPLTEILGADDYAVHPRPIADQLAEIDRRVLATGKQVATKEVLQTALGEKLQFWSVKLPLKREGMPDCLLGISTDITTLIDAQQQNEFKGRILELLAIGKPLNEVLEAIVRGIEQLHPDLLCSILLLDETGRRFTKIIAPSLPGFYNEAISGLEIGVGLGSCGTAAATGCRVIVSDISTHPYWDRYRELAHRAGLMACWSQPIFSSKREILGTFAIYQRQPGSPTDSDLTLIEKTAHLASIAVEKNQADEAIHDFAFYDSLTRLPNRRLLSDRLSIALASSQRTGKYGAVLSLDLDRFKPLNDTHGHDAGDLLLIDLAGRLKQAVREVDTVARIGGDEFIIVLNGLSPDLADSRREAIQIAEKLRNVADEPYTIAVNKDDGSICHVEHQCTASIGVALFRGEDLSQNQILRRADDAMYRAKASGKDTVKLFDV